MASQPGVVGVLDDEVLIFGASSQIGDALLPLLGSANHLVRAISRNPPADRSGLRWVRGDFSSTKASPPRVISLGPLADFASWLESADGINRVIAVGSVSLRHKSGSSAAEERAVAALLADAEERIKRRCSQLNAQLTLLRPCMLYGAGRDRTVAPALRFAQDRGWLPLPSPAAGLRQPLHLADLAEALRQCLQGAAQGETLELGGAERLRFDQLLRRIVDCVPDCRPRPLPLQALRWTSALAAPWSAPIRRINRALNRANIDQLPDETLTHRCLDWQPRAFNPAQLLDTAATSSPE